MISYTFENEIFQVKLDGDVELKDILNFLSEFSKIENLPKDLILLYDLDSANFKFDPSNLKDLSNNAELSTIKYTSIKTAFLTNDPRLNAYSTIFSNQAEEKRTKRKIFSTKQAAIDWLLKKD